MFVECVFRTMPRGEIIWGQFDTETGKIVEYPELFECANTKDIKWIAGNYASPDEYDFRRIDLMYQICSEPQALIVVNYNNIGFVVYTQTKCWIHYLDPGMLDTQKVSEDIVRYESARYIGVLKTKVQTYCYLQPLARIVAVKVNGVEVVYTNAGKYAVDYGIQELTTVDRTKYAPMVLDKSAYGFGNKGSKCVTLMVVNKTIVVGGEL